MPVIYPSSIPDPEYMLLPEGEYSVKVGEVEETTTRMGDVMWKVMFRVTAGEFLHNKVFTNLVFTEKALGNIKVFCKAIGLDMNADRLDLHPDDIERATLRVLIAHESYEGKTRAKIPYAGFMPLVESSETPSPQQGTQQRPQQAQPEPPAYQQPEEAQSFGSEECPF